MNAARLVSRLVAVTAFLSPHGSVRRTVAAVPSSRAT